jgi:hypothetical protein
MIKPGELFFGLMEFLAFIVPGFILCMTLPIVIHLPFLASLDIANPKASSFTWFSFIMISYILGHFLHHICAMILNPIYETTYLKLKSKKHKSFVLACEKTIVDKLPLRTDSLKAAEAYLRVNNSNVLPELERHEANSKLFRSLCLLCIYLCFIVDFNWTIVISLIIAAAFSFSKFANQRWAHRFLVYQYFLITVK